MKRIVGIFMAASASMILLPLHAADTPKNLLQNSDFKVASAPDYPDCWAGASGWRPKTHKLVDDAFIPGTRSMTITNADGKETTFFSGNFGWSPGKAGTSYTFSVYLKGTPAGLHAQIGSTRCGFKTVTVTAKWERYTASGQLNKLDGFPGRFISPTITLPPDDKGTLYINAPMLTTTEVAVPYNVPSAGNAQTGKMDRKRLDISLLGFWSFGAANGNQIPARGKGDAGKINGSFIPGKTTFGPGMTFDGTNFVEIPYNAALNATPTEVTVEIALKPEAAKDMPILNRGMHWGGYALMVGYGKYKPLISPWQGVYAEVLLPESVHLVMTYQKPNLEFYVNGAPVNKSPLDVEMEPEGNRRPLIIGGTERYEENLKRYQCVPGFRGVINYVKTYKRHVDADEVITLYKNTKENCR